MVSVSSVAASLVGQLMSDEAFGALQAIKRVLQANRIDLHSFGDAVEQALAPPPARRGPPPRPREKAPSPTKWSHLVARLARFEFIAVILTCKHRPLAWLQRIATNIGGAHG